MSSPPSSDADKVTAGLEELSLKKQLPLRQQRDKPVLKYSTYGSANISGAALNNSGVVNSSGAINSSGTVSSSSATRTVTSGGNSSVINASGTVNTSGTINLYSTGKSSVTVITSGNVNTPSTVKSTGAPNNQPVHVYHNKDVPSPPSGLNRGGSVGGYPPGGASAVISGPFRSKPPQPPLHIPKPTRTRVTPTTTTTTTTSSNKYSNNPYSRPVSAQDVQEATNSLLMKSSSSSNLLSSSNSSLSSNGSAGSCSYSAAASDCSPKPSTPVQNNSFLRPRGPVSKPTRKTESRRSYKTKSNGSVVNSSSTTIFGSSSRTRMYGSTIATPITMCSGGPGGVPQPPTTKIGVSPLSAARYTGIERPESSKHVPKPPADLRPKTCPSPNAVVTSVDSSSVRVRNPSYTPTKPYCDVSTSEYTEHGATEILVTSDSDISIGAPLSIQGRKATPVTNKTGVAPSGGGGGKKMPVTGTITGTVFYKKASKPEETIPGAKRANGDGSSSSLREHLERRLTDMSTDYYESGDSEWEDEGEETEYGGPDTDAFSERLPGDGADSVDDYNDDPDAAEDAFEEGIDDIEDDICEDEDESDGQSITSSISRKSSATRVRSAARRLSKLSLSEKGGATAHRPQTARPITVTRIQPSVTPGEDAEIQPGLTMSYFPGVPPSINFVGEGEKVELVPWDLRKLFKWRMSPITPNVVKNCIARSGFRATRKSHDWIGCWGKHMKSQGFKAIREYQKVNHFPGSFQIGRKDRLWRNLSKMQVHFGKREFGFFPHTYVLPYDLKLLKRAWEDGTAKQKWIIKPPASARGIGIRVIHKWSQIPKKRPVIVQKYLSRPYLINDSKFDLRIYVYVTCYDPLRIYVYEDGLARFASHKYSNSMKALSNKYMHLTNYSINKKSHDYQSNSDEAACTGHKWTMKSLWGHMKKQGVNTTAVWESIKDLIVKTIISSEGSINSLVKSNVRRRCSVHELFGFDVMLDENLKPWIIEVNISPSLHSNSQLDITVKGGMIKDLLNIAGFQVPDKNDVVANPGPAIDRNNNREQGGVVIDRRLWPSQMSPDERAKHAYYCQRQQDEIVQQTILDTFTPNDVRILVESIDEDSRRGRFERVFPSPKSHKYLRFFDAARYYNLLLDQWVLKFHRIEARGIALLESICAKGIHFENPTDDPRHQWSPPHIPLSRGDPRAISAPVRGKPATPINGTHSSGSSPVLPKLKKKKKQSFSISSSSTASLNSLQSEPAAPTSHMKGTTRGLIR